MAEHQRNWDDQNRNRIKLQPQKPSDKKKRQLIEQSGEIGDATSASIYQAGTPKASPDRETEDTDMGAPPATLGGTSTSLESLVSHPPPQDSEARTAELYSNERDHHEEESNHRRKISRQSSRHSSASDQSRGRSDFALTPLTPLTPADPTASMASMATKAPISSFNTPIDEWQTGISMSWITPKDDADYRSNVKILTHDWKLHDAQIRAVNKNTNQSLVEMGSGWYLFSEGMNVGQAVARSKEQTMQTLGAQPPMFSAEAVRLPPHYEVSPKTNLATILEESMPGWSKDPLFSPLQPAPTAQMENVRPNAPEFNNKNNNEPVRDEQSNSMDID